MDTLKSLIKKYAYELGFDLVAITTADPFLRDRDIALERLKKGLMDGLPWYTQTRVERGSDPRKLLLGARSIIALGMSYLGSQEVTTRSTSSLKKPKISRQGKVARYAWGQDYHKVMKKRMNAFVKRIEEHLAHSIEARFYVDDGPMLDRAVAQRAGLGWFGKNTNILTSSHGSWIFLGQVLTDLELEPDTPSKKTCGNCTKCIVACPTQAIVAPYVIDNKKCISYLTIENRGSIPRHMRPQVMDWVFGCDICQEVCPVNRKVNYSCEPEFQRGGFTTLDLVDILEMTEEEFQERFRGSALKRAKRVGLQRNACVALGNLGDSQAVPALAKALLHGEVLVRGHAAWALGKLGGQTAATTLKESLVPEKDSWVREEIELALNEHTS